MSDAQDHEIQLEKKADGSGSFFVEVNGERVARILWKEIPEGIEVISTSADESMRGTGVARQLVAKVVEYARANNHKIRATCPYANKVLRGEPATVDLLID